MINVDWTVKEDEVSSADIKDDGEDPSAVLAVTVEGDAEGETEDAAGVCKAGVCDVAIDTGVEKAVMLGVTVTVGEKQKQNCVNIVLAGLTEGQSPSPVCHCSLAVHKAKLLN